MKTTDDREKDILSLCDTILHMNPVFHDNPNGGYEHSCPFCGGMVSYGTIDSPDMKELPHDPHCAYLLAKDISTNLL